MEGRVSDEKAPGQTCAGGTSSRQACASCDTVTCLRQVGGAPAISARPSEVTTAVAAGGAGQGMAEVLSTTPTLLGIQPFGNVTSTPRFVLAPTTGELQVLTVQLNICLGWLPAVWLTVGTTEGVSFHGRHPKSVCFAKMAAVTEPKLLRLPVALTAGTPNTATAAPAATPAVQQASPPGASADAAALAAAPPSALFPSLDFSRFCFSDELSDIELVAGGSSFSAHRCVRPHLRTPATQFACNAVTSRSPRTLCMPRPVTELGC